jgi:hypothetical protein
MANAPHGPKASRINALHDDGLDDILGDIRDVAVDRKAFD